jgi:hypothetical protein
MGRRERNIGMRMMGGIGLEDKRKKKNELKII